VADTIVQQHAAYNQFLFNLAGAVQQAGLYELENKIMVDPINRLDRMLRTILQTSPTFTFQGADQNLYVNGQRLRCDGPTFTRHQTFLKLLDGRKASGLTFTCPLEVKQWKTLLTAIAKVDKNSSSPFEDMMATLSAGGMAELIEILPTSTQAALTAAKKVQSDKRLYAIRAYCKCIHLLQEFIKSLDNAVRRGYFHVKLLRAAQELVTAVEQGGWKYFGLVNTKDYHAYLYNHSVNVAVLSLVLGVRLGLRRDKLAELAMAGMMHDVGKAMLPRDLMDKRGAFTDEEKKILATAPELGVKAVLQQKLYNESVLKRVVVIGEHGEAMGERTDHHPYSRIVAIAETFDALTTDRPHRLAFPPDQAVKMLMKLSETRLDRGLVTLFVQTVGLWPCGTLVELSDGSVAVTFHPHPDRKKWASPIVRIVKDKNRVEQRNPPVVDLSETNPPLAIVKTLEPGSIGVNVSGFLYEDAAAAKT
jgi:HD-GYP domain-containing protein (c-di-GMP phosphodiesterase class II)